MPSSVPVPSGYIPNNSITSAKIKDNDVVAADLAPSSVGSSEIANDAVIDTKIADGAVTANKIPDGSIAIDKLENTPTGTILMRTTGGTGGWETVTLANAALALGSGGAGVVADGSITSSKLADSAVVDSKIAVNAVTNTKILDGAITSGKIAALNVTNALIATNAVTSDKILDANVTVGKLADESVIASKIATDAVTTAAIAASAVTSSEIADLAVIENKISASAVTSAKIASGNVNNTHIAADAVQTVQIQNAAVNASKLAVNAVTSGSIAAGAVTDTKLATDAVTNIKILTGAVTTAKIADNAVTGTQILDGSVPIAKLGNTTQNRMLMRTASGSGPWQDLSVVEAGSVLGVSPGGPITPAPNDPIDTTGVTDSRVQLQELIDDHIGEFIHLPPGTIRIGGFTGTGGGLYSANGAIIVKAGTTLIGHEYGTTILCDTPQASQQYLYLESNVTLKRFNIKFDNTTATPRGTSSVLVIALLAKNLNFYDMNIDGGGIVNSKINHSVMNLLMYGCSDIKFLDSSSRYAMSNAFGFQMFGCKRVLIENANINSNGWDGLKVNSGQVAGVAYSALEFYPSSYNASTSVITSPTSLAGISDNDHSVRFEGILPAGMVSGREYFMKSVSGNTFQIQDVRGSGITKTFGVAPSTPQVSTTCTVSGNSINPTGDTTRTPVVGEAVRFTGVTLPTGLVVDVDYYIRAVTGVNFTLAQYPILSNGSTSLGNSSYDYVLSGTGSSVQFVLRGPKATYLQYGISEAVTVVDTELNDNGFAVLSLPSPASGITPTATYTTVNSNPAQNLANAYGNQYRLNVAGDTNFAIPNSTPGVVLEPPSLETFSVMHVAKQIGSKGTPYLIFNSGDTITHSLDTSVFNPVLAADDPRTLGGAVYQGSLQTNTGVEARHAEVNETVTFSDGTPPTGFSNDVDYYCIQASASGYMACSATPQGTPIPFTNAGTSFYTLNGRNYAQVRFAYSSSLNIHPDNNVYRLVETAAGWHVSAWGNGEGFDGAGRELSLVNVTSNRNQGAGFQMKPVSPTEEASGLSLVRCKANYNYGHAFSVVNATAEGGKFQFAGNLALTGCEAVGNQGAGFTVTTARFENASVVNCIFRSNRDGINLSEFCKNFKISNCHLLGNGPARDSGNPDLANNLIVKGAANVSITDCHLSGVDLGFSNLHTALEKDGVLGVCRGALIQKTSGGITMSGTILDGNTFHNHWASKDLVYLDSVEIQSDTNNTTFWTAFTPDLLLEKTYPRHKKRLLLSNEDARSVAVGRAVLPTAADAGDLGLLTGAFTLDSTAIAGQQLVGRALSDVAGPITDSARWLIQMPEDYVTGKPVNVAVRCKEALSIAPYDGIDANLTHQVRVKPIAALHSGSTGADICTTAATSFRSVTTATYRHTITPTALFPGQLLEVAVSIVLTRIAGVPTRPEVSECWLEY